MKTLKEVYFLAVLGSLCIAIAAFTGQDYPEAQTYALTAASLFLVAFMSSLAVKIFSIDFYVIVTYVTSAVGILMLFLVIWEFSKTIPLLKKCFDLVASLITLFVILHVVYSVEMLIDRKKKPSLIAGVLLAFTCSIVIFIFSIAIIQAFFEISLIQFNIVLGYVLLSSLLIMVVLLIAISLNSLLEHRKKKANNEK